MHVQIAKQPRQRQGRESAISSRCIGDGDVETFATLDESLDVDQIAQLRPFQQCAEFFGEDRACGIDEDLSSSDLMQFGGLDCVHWLRDQVQDDASIALGDLKLYEGRAGLERCDRKTVARQSLLYDPWQIAEIVAPPPKKIQVSCRPVPEVNAGQCRTSAENEARLDARERGEHSQLQRIELTA